MGQYHSLFRTAPVVCLPALAALLLAPYLHAQRGTGELRLSVHDASGAGLPASVSLANASTGTDIKLSLPSDGRYAFRNLPFGVYRLEVASSGFQPYTNAVEVRSEVPKSLEVTLGIAPVGTTVEVTSIDTLVDPKRTGTAYYVGARQVRQRQSGTAGRGIIDLVNAQPGWLLEANGVLHPRLSEYQTQYLVNGFPELENRSPAFAPAMDADDVESMKVYTSGIPAEYGRKLGGVVEVTTQRNTSPGFHGIAAVSGGSFGTLDGFLSGQYVAGRTTATLGASGLVTDRFLDPPVQDNFTNHASGASANGSLERDLGDSDRLRVSAVTRRTRFLVPNELLQQAAGQRQDRGDGETEGDVSYQHVFSPELVGALRGMVRDVSARLWSNPLATPIAANQDRGFREVYLNGSLSGHRGRHEWKAGVEASFASIRETFGYDIVAYELNGVPVFDPSTPPSFRFAGTANDREQAAFLQDTIRLGNFTVNAGLRFDHYRLLVDETAFSPRLALSWYWPSQSLVLHASYDRIFGTPAFENILVSASPATRALNDDALYLPLHASRGNYYDAGFVKGLAGKLRVSASYFRRDLTNFADDDLLLNTGVSFPIAFRSAVARGVEVKVDTPGWGPFSGFVSYSNMIGLGRMPIAGGLFLEGGESDLLQSTEQFAITQDQRNTVRVMLHYQVTPRLWIASTGSYNSGLPVEATELQPPEFLAAQYGPEVLERVNFSRGRVRPSSSIDLSVGVTLLKHDRRSVTLQADAINITDRLNVINFAGLFSGTAVAPGRSFGFRLRCEF